MSYEEEIGSLYKKIERLRAALEHVRAVCMDNAPAPCNKGMALNFVRSVVEDALREPRDEQDTGQKKEPQ